METRTTWTRCSGVRAAFVLVALTGCGGDDLIDPSGIPGQQTESPDRPGSRTLAFICDSESEGTEKLYLSDHQGQNRVQVDSRDSIYNMTISPDGRWVAYLSNGEAGETDLYTVKLSSASDPIRINDAPPGEGKVRRYKWSPDGSALAYYTYRDDNESPDFYVAPANGGNETTLIMNAASDGAVERIRWSPDSERLAFVSDQAEIDVYELYTIARDGSQKNKVNPPLVDGGDVSRHSSMSAHDNIKQHSVQWSPDGERIAYQADQDTVGEFELYSARPDGTDLQKVHPEVGTFHTVNTFRWSPDGNFIAYRYDHAIYVNSTDGQQARLIHNIEVTDEGGGDLADVMWSPQGDRIAFRTDERKATNFDLYVVSPDGTDVERVGPPGDRDSIESHRWSPEGTHLAYSVEGESLFYQDPSPLYTLRVDDMKPTKVNPELMQNGLATRYAWSPDSLRLAFMVRETDGSPYGLYTVRADGGDLLKLDQADLRLDSFESIRWRRDSAGVVYRFVNSGTDPETASLLYTPYDGAFRTRLSPESCGSPGVDQYEVVH